MSTTAINALLILSILLGCSNDCSGVDDHTFVINRKDHSISVACDNCPGATSHTLNPGDTIIYRNLPVLAIDTGAGVIVARPICEPVYVSVSCSYDCIYKIR